MIGPRRRISLSKRQPAAVSATFSTSVLGSKSEFAAAAAAELQV